VHRRSANATGGFTKERFGDRCSNKRTSRCPHRHVATITFRPDESGVARLHRTVEGCSLRSAGCTKSQAGRSVSINQHEAILQVGACRRTRSAVARHLSGPDRPLVERKDRPSCPAQLGWTPARTRGLRRVATDLDTRAGSINWARLATLGLHSDPPDGPLQEAKSRDRLQTRNSGPEVGNSGDRADNNARTR